MSRIDTALFASIVSWARGQALTSDPGFSADEWEDLLRLAAEQEILPLVCDSVCGCSSYRHLDRERRIHYRDKSISLAVRQIVQTNEFLTLMLHAQERGLDPIVLKGIVVRSLYPKPMLRLSVDEDLFVSRGELRAYHEFFLSEGLTPDDPEADLDRSLELSYHRHGSPTYIELHTDFLPSDSDAYSECNAALSGASERSTQVTIEDVTMRTLSPTDHILYLILHAYKHFLHGGFGIRQVCDIGMFSEHYADSIDASHVMSECEKLHIGRFAAALFRICEQELGFPEGKLFPGVEVDTHDLLEDIMSGGLYGMNDINRAHSSTLTLDAVASQRTGRRRKGAFHSVFLPLKDLVGRYPYLRKRPWLLPAAWVQRIWNYLFKRENGAVSPSESLRIGRDRIELLREYEIID